MSIKNFWVILILSFVFETHHIPRGPQHFSPSTGIRVEVMHLESSSQKVEDFMLSPQGKLIEASGETVEEDEEDKKNQ